MICPPGKAMSFHKKETEKFDLVATPEGRLRSGRRRRASAWSSASSAGGQPWASSRWRTSACRCWPPRTRRRSPTARRWCRQAAKQKLKYIVECDTKNRSTGFFCNTQPSKKIKLKDILEEKTQPLGVTPLKLKNSRNKLIC